MISWFGGPCPAVLRADLCLCSGIFLAGSGTIWEVADQIQISPVQSKSPHHRPISLLLPTLCPFPGLRKEQHSTELETFTFLLGKRPVGCSRPLCSCPALTCRPMPPKSGHSLWTWRAVLAWWARLSFAVKGTKRRSQPSPFPTAPHSQPTPTPALSTHFVGLGPCLIVLRAHSWHHFGGVWGS